MHKFMYKPSLLEKLMDDYWNQNKNFISFHTKDVDSEMYNDYVYSLDLRSVLRHCHVSFVMQQQPKTWAFMINWINFVLFNFITLTTKQTFETNQHKDMKTRMCVCMPSCLSLCISWWRWIQSLKNSCGIIWRLHSSLVVI